MGLAKKQMMEDAYQLDRDLWHLECSVRDIESYELTAEQRDALKETYQRIRAILEDK